MICKKGSVELSVSPLVKTQLTRQIGEHLVVAELGRCNIVATPFAGNMPIFDIVALSANSLTIYVQVKAINKGDWQLNAKHFLNIKYNSITKRQTITGLHIPSIDPLFLVLIKIVSRSSDDFYVIPFAKAQALVKANYRRKSGKSTHFALRQTMVTQFKVTSLADVFSTAEDRFSGAE